MSRATWRDVGAMSSPSTRICSCYLAAPQIRVFGGVIADAQHQRLREPTRAGVAVVSDLRRRGGSGRAVGVRSPLAHRRSAPRRRSRCDVILSSAGGWWGKGAFGCCLHLAPSSGWCWNRRQPGQQRAAGSPWRDPASPSRPRSAKTNRPAISGLGDRHPDYRTSAPFRLARVAPQSTDDLLVVAPAPRRRFPCGTMHLAIASRLGSRPRGRALGPDPRPQFADMRHRSCAIGTFAARQRSATAPRSLAAAQTNGRDAAECGSQSYLRRSFRERRARPCSTWVSHLLRMLHDSISSRNVPLPRCRSLLALSCVPGQQVASC